MAEANDMYTLLIRGEGLAEAEIGRLRKVEAELGRDKLFQLVSKKKIIPFAARTFELYGIDAAFWKEQLELFRTRNRKILHCLSDAYASLRRHGVRKMFVSENFGALLSANGDIGLFASGDVDNYADPCERDRIYQAFDELGEKKLLTVKTLNMEYAELLSAKKKAFTEYTNARAEMREVMTVKANVEHILNHNKRLRDRKLDGLYLTEQKTEYPCSPFVYRN